MWLVILSTTLLFAAPSPSGRWIAERRLVDDAWRGRIVATDGGATIDLGPFLFPIGWEGDDDRLRVARLVDDGHELIGAASGVVCPNKGAAVTWAAGAPLIAIADAWRNAYAARGPSSTNPAPFVVAIDPGHGGAGAGTWNGNNGDGAGARGPNGLTEQWVNLRVAGFLAADLARDPRFAGSFRVRTTATQTVTLADRVALAAQGGADFYLSIHHNGLPTGATNRTETYWCGLNAHADECPDMAWRLHDRIVDAFGYTGRGAFEDSAGTGRFHFYVLRHAPMPAVLTEASNLNDAAEEARFGNDPIERHAKAEAVALHLGLVELAFGTTGVTETMPGAETPPDPDVLARLGPVDPRGGDRFEVAFETTGAGRFEASLIDPAGRLLARAGVFEGPGRGHFGGPRGGAGPCWLVVRRGGTIVASCFLPRW